MSNKPRQPHQAHLETQMQMNQGLNSPQRQNEDKEEAIPDVLEEVSLKHLIVMKKNPKMTSMWGWKEYCPKNLMGTNPKPINSSYSSNISCKWTMGQTLHEIWCQKLRIFYHCSLDQRLSDGSNDNMTGLIKLKPIHMDTHYPMA